MFFFLLKTDIRIKLKLNKTKCVTDVYLIIANSVLFLLYTDQALLIWLFLTVHANKKR